MICAVCDVEAARSELAAFPTAAGDTAHVHVSPGACQAVLAGRLDEIGDPPREFAAAKARMDTLAALTGRKPPPVVAVRHEESGVWHWADV